MCILVKFRLDANRAAHTCFVRLHWRLLHIATRCLVRICTRVLAIGTRVSCSRSLARIHARASSLIV